MVPFFLNLRLPPPPRHTLTEFMGGLDGQTGWVPQFSPFSPFL